MDQKPQSGAVPVLGLIAGLGLGAGIVYYRALVERYRAMELPARILLAHAEVDVVLPLATARRCPELAAYLHGLLRQLAAGGAELGIIPAWTPLICGEALQAAAPLPLLGILQPTLEALEQRRLSRVSIFGSRVTVETGLFGHATQVCEVVPPRPEETDQIGGIYGQVVRNAGATPEEFTTLRRLAHTLIARERLDAIVLAGTDLSCVFTPENTDFPHLDSARVHIDAILRRAAGAVPAAGVLA